MANKEHLQKLVETASSTNVGSWNRWRKANPNFKPDLSDVDLSNKDLRVVNLSDTNMSRANLSDANLAGANLNGTNLTDADLCGADLSDADLRCAHLRRADLTDANLTGADMRFADLRGVCLTGAKLFRARVNPSEIQANTPEGSQLIHSLVEPEILEQPDRPTGAGVGRLAKIALGLFKRKELMTLRLNEDEEEATEDRSGPAPAHQP